MDRSAVTAYLLGRGEPTGAEPLDRWLAAHGPLSSQAAAVVALRLCSRASAMSDAELRAAAPCLSTSAIVRGSDGEWAWAPGAAAHLVVEEAGTGAGSAVAPIDEPAGRPVAATRRSRWPGAERSHEPEVVERIGAALFEILTAQPLRDRFADEGSVRAQLRRARPDISPAMSDVVARAASAQRGRRVSLDGLARDLRRVLGIEDSGDTRPRRRFAAAAAAALVVVAAIVAGRLRAGDDRGRPGAHGLSPRETVINEMVLEQAHHLALTDEHTLALQELQDLERLWRTRVPSNDPRTVVNMMMQAWVRYLRGDALTAEQYVVMAPLSLARDLGAAHPYTRTAHLQLATVLETRGATAEAAKHRAAATLAATTLLGSRPDVGAEPAGTGTAASSAGGATSMPSPFSVLAHMAPNAPEREGFRRTGPTRYTLALTSTQRWLAEQHGWQLVVRASGDCLASVDVGRDPRRVTVAVTRGPDQRWRVAIEGVSPPLVLEAGGASSAPGALAAPGAAGEAVAIITTASDGSLQARLNGLAPLRASLQHVTSAADPPYVLGFSPLPDGCRLVWWEVGPNLP